MILRRPRSTDPRLVLGSALALALPLGASWAAFAQTPVDQTAPSAAPAENAAPAADALKQHDQELDAIRAKQRESADSQAKLRSQITALGEDRRALNKQLIDTAARVRDVEAKIDATQARLKSLDDTKTGF